MNEAMQDRSLPFIWPNLFYGHKELQQLQDFDQEYSKQTQVCGVSVQSIRKVMLLLILMPFVTSYVYWDWHYFLVPFTNWTLIISTAYICMSLRAGSDRDNFSKLAIDPRIAGERYARSLKLQAIHHLLYTFAIICNFVVMSVYWPVLHSEQVKLHYNDPGVGHGRVFHMKIVHSIPGTVCLINASLSYVKLKPEFWKLISGVVILYLSFVYTVWKTTGRI